MPKYRLARLEQVPSCQQGEGQRLTSPSCRLLKGCVHFSVESCKGCLRVEREFRVKAQYRCGEDLQHHSFLLESSWDLFASLQHILVLLHLFSRMSGLFLLGAVMVPPNRTSSLVHLSSSCSNSFSMLFSVFSSLAIILTCFLLHFVLAFWLKSFDTSHAFLRSSTACRLVLPLLLLTALSSTKPVVCTSASCSTALV